MRLFHLHPEDVDVTRDAVVVPIDSTKPKPVKGLYDMGAGVSINVDLADFKVPFGVNDDVWGAVAVPQEIWMPTEIVGETV